MTPELYQAREKVPTLAWTIVGALFVGSGFAAMVYELAWFQLVRLVIGASWMSLGILLATFMGGMCLGSLALPLVVPTRFHPLRVYAFLELAIGAFGGAIPIWLPWLSQWYLANVHPSFTGVAVRALVAAVCILPPTILMGATLPAIARWVHTTPQGLSQLGLFYGANIFGAVAGCVVAGFVLLPQTDVNYASNVAAVMNVLVATAAVALSYLVPHQLRDQAPLSIESAPRNAPAVICAIVAISGFTALVAEIVWTRLLAMLLGSTVYTFAIILAVFLGGLGIGSVIAAFSVRWIKRPLRWLGVAQLSIACIIPLTNYVITRVVPYQATSAAVSTYGIYGVFWRDTLRAAESILPAAILWGASFPLALAAAGKGPNDAGRLVGQIYAANTLGAIFGAILAGASLIPLLGSHQTQQWIVFSAGLAAIWAIQAASKPSGTTCVPPRSHSIQRLEELIDSVFLWLASPLGRVALLTVVAVAAWNVAAPPCGLFARAQHPRTWCQDRHDVFSREGRSATVVVQKQPFTGRRFLSVGGKIEASTLVPDLRCERLLGHLPALFHPAPKKTLTVGLGTGITAGCFVLHPEVEQIAICEIEPIVRDAADAHFARENHDVAGDPRTEFHFDDARHFLATTDQRFDVITSDPVNSWVRGAAALYSAEYFELCKRHLNPGGIVVQWIPLYEKDLDTAKCELATFLQAFPHATLWTSWTEYATADQRHDVIAVGQLEPRTIDLAELNRRIEANPKLQAALNEIHIGTIPELFGQYIARGEDLRPWLAGAEINRDRSLRLEYLAGLSMRTNQATAIFRQMAAYRRYPTDLLINDDPYKDDLLRRPGLRSSGQ